MPSGCSEADLFAQGYGEETTHVFAPAGWVGAMWPSRDCSSGTTAARPSGSQPTAEAPYIGANATAELVEQVHPGHQSLIAHFLNAGTLAESRRRMDLLAWSARGRRWRQAALLISHNDGGGRAPARLSAGAHVDAGAADQRRDRPKPTAENPPLRFATEDRHDLPNLVFAMWRERQALLRLLRASKADSIEIHHLADYPASIYYLIAKLGLPYDVHVHDYALFCPRVSLVAAHNRFCGEPDLRDCEACVADHGHFLKETIGVGALRLRCGSARALLRDRPRRRPSDATLLSGAFACNGPHEDDNNDTDRFL